MLEELIKVNNYIIASAKDEEEKKKQLLIKKILNDKECFLKMDIETTYALLRELNISEDKLKEVYTNLINPV